MIHFYWDTITNQIRQVMAGFAQSELGARFYLAGGTALALQLGHRRSVDLDFFSATEDIASIKVPLQVALQAFDPILLDTSWGNLLYLANAVRVGFYSYGYPMVSALVDMEGIQLAGIADIGLMKLDALLGRASRKDFVDLYVICQKISLRQLLDLAPQKYPSVRDFEAQVVQRMVYFEVAEQEEPVSMLQPADWDIVKQYFRQQAISLGRGWIE
jgi:hypothetical protein